MSIKFVFLIVFCGVITKTYAQKPDNAKKMLSISNIVFEPTTPISEISKHINKEIYLGETIWGAKVINDSIKILYMGGIYPNHRLSVILKGKKVVDGLSNFNNGNILFFSGTVSLLDGIPTITISHLGQVGRRVMI